MSNYQELDGFALSAHGFALSAHGFASGFSSADFQDAEEIISGEPIQEMVQNILGHHLRENVTPAPSQVNWRKRLREMMTQQKEKVLSFLARPVTEHSLLGPVEIIIRRYSIRQEVAASSVKTCRQLLADISGSTVNQDIAEALAKKGASSLTQMKEQINTLMEMYKNTGQLLMDEENRLKISLEKIDKVQKRVSTIMELQENEATTDLIASLEKYLAVSFRETDIETSYKNIIKLYQRHLALREAIQVFKVQDNHEPPCPICLEDSVGTAISPCGHTFCSSCSKKMVNECGMCRGKIRDRLKLFFA
jgi:hypothetical protein